ncbi:hypothetical protein GCM10007242_45480 [Pigmentiphaga litoralis]|uniref:hypothetical protein n=1 Tax=Pigmentiphaga litoralis TaxID=516702 RepID=UPI0016739294|nr:hypothetical protein [Pigmentiphaga litoralis]GGX33246.1 hypothetical protein GCM10007242_45480 [Pigmentiphaga litoralis]
MDQVNALLREWSMYPPMPVYVRQQLQITAADTDFELAAPGSEVQDDEDIDDEFDELERLIT